MSLTKCLIAMFSRSKSMSDARRFFWREAKVMVVIVLNIVACLLMACGFIQELQVSAELTHPYLPLGLSLVHLAFTVGCVSLLYSYLNSKVSTDQYAWSLRLFRLRASLGLQLPKRSMTKKDLFEYAILSHESEISSRIRIPAVNRR